MTEPVQDAQIEEILGRMSPAELVGQLVVPYVTGATADEPHPENRERFGVDTAAEAITRFAFGGVIYFAWAHNTATPVQIAGLSDGLQRAALGAGAGVPLTVATDQETGTSSRIGAPATVLPGAMALGATGDLACTTDAFTITGRELRAMGINLDYAPTADVNVNPDNPVIGIRSFGEDPDVVAAHVVAGVDGLQRSGVSATVKHFPGHGDTAVDSHAALPVITHDRATWERLDAAPFRAAVTAGVDSVMTAHIAFPALDPSGEPATLSQPVITGLLRDELGYDGVVVTDSLRMEGVRQRYDDGEVGVRALLAGADVLLDPPWPAQLVAAVLTALAQGRLSHDRLVTSVRRVLRMKAARGVISDPWSAVDPMTVVGCAEHLASARRLTAAAITQVGGTADVPWSSGRVLVLGWGEEQVASLGHQLEPAHVVTTMITGPDPDAAAVSAAVAAAADHDRVVIITGAGWRHPGQQGLVAAVRTVTEPVVVAVADPYDAGRLGPGCYLLSYSPTSVAITAVADVLLGREQAPGRSPVSLDV